MAYNAGLYTFNCNFPRLFMLYVIADVTLFLYLFLMFYKRTYEQKLKSKIHTNWTNTTKYLLYHYSWKCNFLYFFMSSDFVFPRISKINKVALHYIYYKIHLESKYLIVVYKVGSCYMNNIFVEQLLIHCMPFVF